MEGQSQDNTQFALQRKAAYSDPWYAKNRTQVLEKRRKQHARTRQFLTDPEERQICLADPRKIKEVLGDGLIVCPGTKASSCWFAAKSIADHVRVHFPASEDPAGDFRAEWELPVGFKLVSKASADKMAARKNGRRPAVDPSKLRSAAREGLRKRRGTKLSRWAHEGFREKHHARAVPRKTRYQVSQPHVSADELARLRQPDNRLEALAYGAEKRCVCLDCGRIGEDLSRHVTACAEKAQSSSAYRKEWGYNKSNPLVSAKLHERNSHAHISSPKAQVARKANESIWRRAFAAEAKRGERPNRRGPLRDEARLRRSVPRPSTRKFSDEQLRAHLPGLTVSETAQLFGVHPSSVSTRARKLGLETDAYHRQQPIVLKVLAAVRRRYRYVRDLPAPSQVIGWCVGKLRSNGEIPREFRPFFSAFSRELSSDVIRHLIRDPRKKNDLFLLAARILRRARKTQPKPKRGRGRPSGTAKKTGLFQAAKQLRDRGLPLAEIARQLDPQAFATNRRRAMKTIWQGIARLNT